MIDIKDRGRAIEIPVTKDIIDLLENVGFSVSPSFRTELIPILEREVNNEIDLMHARETNSTKFQADVRRWIRHRNWKY